MSEEHGLAAGHPNFVATRQERRKRMSKKLQDKIALITGGTEGIGLATAKLFAREGAYVFITGRRQKELDDAVRAIGSNVRGVQGDVAKLADLDRLYETVAKVKGRIDIVFANAGVGEFVPFGAVTEEHFDKLFNINVRGTLFTVQKALPLLSDGGSIILNGSVASVKGTAAFGVYAASKAAIRSLVRTWTTDARGQTVIRPYRKGELWLSFNIVRPCVPFRNLTSAGVLATWCYADMKAAVRCASANVRLKDVPGFPHQTNDVTNMAA
jgi:NADP-dependent 3-hydroxy acid dehydrogenase YdfG